MPNFNYENRPIWAASGNVANAQAQVTLTATAINTTYISGFEVSGLGATAGSAVLITVAGLAAGTLSVNLGIPAGATVPFSFVRSFPTAQPALFASVIIVTVPAAGAGNTNLSLVAYGFQI